MSRLRFSLIAGALVALAACDEAAAPAGTPGDLTVRAYIDRDASGSFTAGDSALTGVLFAATPATEGAEPAQATTGATGEATFEDLAPGRYTISIVSGAPAGAVLTTNPTPTIGVSFQGLVSGATDFRYAFQPGALSGRIYRDDNGNGTYDAGGDTPGVGFLVTLLAVSGDTAGAVVDTTRTDANGQWAFPRLAPGRYFLRLDNPGTIQYVGGGPERLVIVAPQTPTQVTGVFTGSLVVPIGQARQRAAGANVEIEGVVTVAPGTFTTGTGSANSEVWVQDASGGIAAFQVPTSLGLQVGNRVRVAGVRVDNAQQEQIGSNAAGATFTRLTGDSTITPQTVTVAQALALTGFEGELVTLPGFVVTSVGTGADFTVFGTVDGQAIQLRIESSTGLTAASFTPGSRYSITGILTQFNATVQIKPRGAADVTGPTPIADVRNAAGGTFTVSGALTVAPGSIVSGTNGVNSEIWIQDASGGIAVFSVPTANPDGLALGDILEVSGTRGAFANQIQLATPGLVVTRLSAGTPVTPRTVDSTAFFSRTYEGQLVTLPGFVVTGTNTPSALGAFTVTGTVRGRTAQVRVGGAGTGLTVANFTVGETYTITGVATINNTTLQIKPRTAADVVQGTVAEPARIVINEFMANPATVADNLGEYIELHNAGGTAQDLQGWIIADNGGTNRDTIDVPLVIPAGGFVVLGVNANTATNGGVQVDFQYFPAIALAQGGDRIVLYDPSSAMVDSVEYTSAHSASGVAWGVVDADADNASVAGGNWVAQTTVYATGTTPDRGTPRAPNDGATATIRSSAILRATGRADVAPAPRAADLRR